jgi:hypothetical protein
MLNGNNKKAASVPVATTSPRRRMAAVRKTTLGATTHKRSAKSTVTFPIVRDVPSILLL